MATKDSEWSLPESAYQVGLFETFPLASEAPGTQTAVIHSSKLLDECHLVDEKSTVAVADFLHRSGCCLMSAIMFLDFVPAGCLETINSVFILNLS